MINIEITINNTNFIVEYDSMKEVFAFMDNCIKNNTVDSIKIYFKDRKKK